MSSAALARQRLPGPASQASGWESRDGPQRGPWFAGVVTLPPQSGEQRQCSKRPHVPVLPPGTACVYHARGPGGCVLGVRASVGRSSRGRRTESGHRTRKQGFSPSSGTEAACFGVAGPQRLLLLPPPQFPHLTSGYWIDDLKFPSSSEINIRTNFYLSPVGVQYGISYRCMIQ